MSGWNGWGWTKPAKRPPPANGIAVKRAGTGASWWAQRWIDALHDLLAGDSNRLARGRTYARAGRTHDLAIRDGAVSASVTGSRPTPYRIAIRLPPLAPGVWTKAIAHMASKAQFAAELLAGRMPPEIDEAFEAAGASLFPRRRSDLVTTCTCPDWGDPCKHVAAAHYVLGDAFDRDPFLLFELRGMPKEGVLAALRAARALAAQTADATAAKTKTATKTKTTAPARAPRGAPKARARTRTRTPDAPAALAPDHISATIPTVAMRATAAEYDQPRGPLPALHFRFDAPPSSAALLRQLGPLAAWSDGASPADALAPVVRAAADAARRLATAEPLEPTLRVEERPRSARSVRASKVAPGPVVAPPSPPRRKW